MSQTYYDTSYPPSLWAPSVPSDGRESASPGDTFTDGAITAQDATNAAKLGPIGFVADPLTDWTVGQSMTVNTFQFNWNGTAWAAGVSAAALQAPAEPPVSPTGPTEAPDGTETAQEAPEAPEAS